MNRGGQTWSPDRDQRKFIRDYGNKVLNGEGALFVGAGASRAAGFVDWRGLLTEVADDLDLDIDKEHDLLALAQFHVNDKGGRGNLDDRLIEAFTKDAVPTPVHEVLARLPIDTVWTTNYEQLLEQAYEAAGRRVEVKLSIQNLAQARKGRDVTIYKMHGCVKHPNEAVLTKQDYELYDVKRRLFTDSLKGDFIEKTLLFIGFSFSDPNVERILSKVREQLGQSCRPHFWITRRTPAVCPEGRRTAEELAYERRRADLHSADLKRYGIQTVWVDEYEHISELLQALEAYVMRRGVFVSGAAADAAPLGEARLNELSRALGRELIVNGFNLVSGFGVGIAEQTIIGAYRGVYESTQSQPADRVLIRPFPGQAPERTRAAAFRKHRVDMICRVGALIVLAGNKAGDTGEVTPSPGVREEVEIALELGKPVIPIGISGHVAREVWEAAARDPEKYLPGLNAAAELQTLGDESASTSQLLESVLSLLRRAEAIACGRGR